MSDHYGRLDHLNLDWNPEDKITAEEEQALLVQAKAGDNDAKQRLVDFLLCYALKLVRRWQRRMPGHDLEDLMQIAQLAILDCIERYDFSYGTRLSTIVTFRIPQLIQKQLPNDSLIRVPYRGDHAHAMAYVNTRIKLRPCSLSTPISPDGRATLYDTLGKRDPVVENADDDLRVAAIRRCLPKLHERFRNVLLDRANGLTLDEIGERLGVTRERVRQIWVLAVEKLTGYVAKDFAAARKRAIRSRPRKANGRCAYREAIMAGSIPE